MRTSAVSKGRGEYKMNVKEIEELCGKEGREKKKRNEMVVKKQ